MDKLEPALTDLDKFEPILANLEKFQQVWIILGKLELTQRSLHHFGQALFCFEMFDPVWINMSQFVK